MKEIREAPFDVKIIDLWSIVGESEGQTAVRLSSDFFRSPTRENKAAKSSQMEARFLEIDYSCEQGEKKYPIWLEVAEDEI